MARSATARLDLPGACARARQLATRPFKFTLTGPHMLARTVIDRHYGSPERVAHAIAGVLAEQVAHCHADVIQLDEANLPGSPDEWPWVAAALNRVLGAVAGQGGRSPLLRQLRRAERATRHLGQTDRLLNALQVDHVVMETAHRPAAELAVFRDLRPEIGMGLGVVDIKRTEVETADDIARALERADAAIGPGRVRYIHPDCGLWMLKRSVADAKIRALAAGRDLDQGRAT